VALPRGSVFIGELGLGGEIRAVSQLERRLAEAAQLGMTVAHVGKRGGSVKPPAGLRVARHEQFSSLLGELFRT